MLDGANGTHQLVRSSQDALLQRGRAVGRHEGCRDIVLLGQTRVHLPHVFRCVAELRVVDIDAVVRHLGQVAALPVEHQLQHVRCVVDVHHLLRVDHRVVIARHLPCFMSDPLIFPCFVDLLQPYSNHYANL